MLWLDGCGSNHTDKHPNFLTRLFTAMFSFGFTEKGSSKLHQAIGVYGNGFKSGSMRLGRDALIFTKNGGCQSVGMLSQTYLENIKAQTVIVPIVPLNQQTNILQERLRKEMRKYKCVVFVCVFVVFILCVYPHDQSSFDNEMKNCKGQGSISFPLAFLCVLSLTQCHSLWS